MDAKIGDSAKKNTGRTPVQGKGKQDFAKGQKGS